MSYVNSPIAIEGRTPVILAAGQITPFLEPGCYDVQAVADTYIKTHNDADAVVADSTTGYWIPAGNTVCVRITRGDQRISSSAAARVHRVE